MNIDRKQKKLGTYLLVVLVSFIGLGLSLLPYLAYTKREFSLDEGIIYFVLTFVLIPFTAIFSFITSYILVRILNFEAIPNVIIGLVAIFIDSLQIVFWLVFLLFGITVCSLHLVEC